MLTRNLSDKHVNGLRGNVLEMANDHVIMKVYCAKWHIENSLNNK